MGTISFNILKQAAMKLLLLTLGSILSLGFAQDTYHCPDGWMLEEDRSGCRCFYFSESEMVTREDADYLCQSHNDAWVAELDHPGINYWLKSRLLDMTDIGQYEQFWLGAFTEGRHSEPNNIQGEDCLVLREYHNPFFPVARDYFWNDFNCEASAHYICENVCDLM